MVPVVGLHFHGAFRSEVGLHHILDAPRSRNVNRKGLSGPSELGLRVQQANSRHFALVENNTKFTSFYGPLINKGKTRLTHTHCCPLAELLGNLFCLARVLVEEHNDFSRNLLDCEFPLVAQWLDTIICLQDTNSSKITP